MFPKSFATLILLAATLFAFAHAQQKTVGQFESHEDVGNPAKPGSVVYDAAKQAYTITGSGTNMWAGRDELHYVWKRMKGNFILRARVEFLGKGVDPHRKIGWIVRQSLDADSPHANATVHGDGHASLQIRRKKGAETERVNFTAQSPDVIQLERKGNNFTMSVANFGETFIKPETFEVPLGDEVYVGIYVCSHNKDVYETAVFRDVEITVPVRDGFVPYREYIGSNLEVMDLATKERKVLYRVKDSLQAHNWTRDGKALIYNHNGLLYRFNLATRTPAPLDTGDIKRNNNDHVISFDGKMLGISSTSAEDGNVSMIYTVPITGGKPVKVTKKGHSYLHTWSPDGKFLLFTGRRNDELDIYKIPANGGEEVQLTTAKGVDDGPEYTPDGKYIYFNSFRTGLMQIWRMKPDGSEQTQITNDEFNNWFPHISPDGKWIVFISFPKDIAPGDHPFYKHVYLRLLPTTMPVGANGGSAPKVIAYLYGGQGTINVPSWSPDGKKIAFVSNTDMK
ncbi:MAG: biopolymer transporter TolR [Acidobacteriota bacterium]